MAGVARCGDGTGDFAGFAGDGRRCRPPEAGAADPGAGLARVPSSRFAWCAKPRCAPPVETAGGTVPDVPRRRFTAPDWVDPAPFGAFAAPGGLPRRCLDRDDAGADGGLASGFVAGPSNGAGVAAGTAAADFGGDLPCPARQARDVRALRGAVGSIGLESLRVIRAIRDESARRHTR